MVGLHHKKKEKEKLQDKKKIEGWQINHYVDWNAGRDDNPVEAGDHTGDRYG